MADGDFLDFAARELAHIGMIDRRDVLDGTVVRVRKAYPAYFGEYAAVRAECAPISTDSRICIPWAATACIATTIRITPCWRQTWRSSSITNSGAGKADIWRINAEEDYHEDLGDAPRAGDGVARATG